MYQDYEQKFTAFFGAALKLSQPRSFQMRRVERSNISICKSYDDCLTLSYIFFKKRGTGVKKRRNYNKHNELRVPHPVWDSVGQVDGWDS